MGNLLNLELERAIKDRDNFLKEHPEYQDFQDKLNEEMDRQPDSTARMHVIAHHMRWNLHRAERMKKEMEDELKR